MTNLYTDLAAAKHQLRLAKDHHETVKAIAEMSIVTTGKNADDRKREMIAAIENDKTYIRAWNALRDAEYAADVAQAAIDQAEAERRDREWQIRARLAEALNRQHIESEDSVPDWLQDRRMVGRAKAQAEIDELYT